MTQFKEKSKNQVCHCHVPVSVVAVLRVKYTFTKSYKHLLCGFINYLKLPTDAAVQGEEVGTGLLTYPVLMASDILLYQVNAFHYASRRCYTS